MTRCTASLTLTLEVSVFRIGGVWFAAVAVFLAGITLAWAVVVYTPGFASLVALLAAMCIAIGAIGLRAAIGFPPTRFRSMQSLSDPDRIVRIPSREFQPRYAFVAGALSAASLGVLIGLSSPSGSPLSPAAGAVMSGVASVVLLRLGTRP